MRLRSWLSFFWLMGSVWAQALESAKPLSPMPSVPHVLLRRLSSDVTVRVEVRVSEDGSLEPSLVVGSGGEEVDEGLAEVLSGWRWQPARRDGEPVESVQNLKIKLRVSR